MIRAVGLAGEFITDDTIDLSAFPVIVPLTEDRESTEITLGDQHANVVRTIYELIKDNVIALPEADYLALIELYNTIFPTAPSVIDLDEAATAERLQCFKEIISRISLVEPSIKLVRFIGDILSDRGQFDYFIIHLLGHLARLGLPMRFMFSNHDLNFLQTYRDILNGTPSAIDEGQHRSSGTLALALKRHGIAPSVPAPAASAFSMAATAPAIDIAVAASAGGGVTAPWEQTPTQKEMAREIKEVIDTIYLPNLRLIDYAYSAVSDDDCETPEEQIVLFIHAPAEYNVLIMATTLMRIKWQTDSPAHIMATIDAVNDYFHANFVSKPDGLLSDIFRDGDTLFPSRMSSPFYRIAWDRAFMTMLYPERLGEGPGYKLYVTHGHQPMIPDNVAINEIDLDTLTGKALKIVSEKTSLHTFHQRVSPRPAPVEASRLADIEENPLYNPSDMAALDGFGVFESAAPAAVSGMRTGFGGGIRSAAKAVAYVPAGSPAGAAGPSAPDAGRPMSRFLFNFLSSALERERGRREAEHGDGGAGAVKHDAASPSGR